MTVYPSRRPAANADSFIPPRPIGPEIQLNIRGTGHILPFPGLGFANSRQAAVVNPAFGQVLSIDEENGRSRLVIHHGGGLISVLRNLESISVSRDEWIPRGALIANLPPGRQVSLLPDWSVYLNRVEVDPMLLVSRRINLEAPSS